MNRDPVTENLRAVERHFHSKVEMRLVHSFEMRGARTSRELVFDIGRVV